MLTKVTVCHAHQTLSQCVVPFPIMAVVHSLMAQRYIFIEEPSAAVRMRMLHADCGRYVLLENLTPAEHENAV